MMPMAENSAFGGDPRWDDIQEMATVAEDVGFDGISFADHFVSRPDDPAGVRGFWEVFTIITAVAATTKRVVLSPLVACTAYRNPFLLAKIAESIDEVSHGRLLLGIGAGWSKPDFDMAGLRFDYRVSRFEETVQILYPLLREGHAEFSGTYVSATDARNIPRGPRAEIGGVPIMMGTKGERMMALTAQYADAWNTVYPREPQEIADLLAKLDAACVAIGRDPKTLMKTVGSNIAMDGYLGFRPNPMQGTPEEIVTQMLAFRDAGIEHLVASLDPCTPQTIAAFGRMLELLDAA